MTTRKLEASIAEARGTKLILRKAKLILMRKAKPIEDLEEFDEDYVDFEPSIANLEAHIVKNTKLLANFKGHVRRKNPKMDDILCLPNGKWTIWCGVSYVGTYDTAMDALHEIERVDEKE
jgi:hypothetical protein